MNTFGFTKVETNEHEYISATFNHPRPRKRKRKLSYAFYKKYWV
jgi:hypothetical protein